MSTDETKAGTTKECLTKFDSEYSFLAAKHLMADFVQVKPETVSSWLRTGRMPTGAGLLRLRVFLYLVGYRVEEFDSLPQDNQKLAMLISLNALDVKEANHRLGYRDDSGIYDLTLKGRTMMSTNAFRLESVLNEFSGSAEETREEFRQLAERVLRGQSGYTARSAGQHSTHDELSPNGDESMSPEVLQELLRRMDERNEQLQSDLEAEREAHEATRAELEALKAQPKPVSVPAGLARKYLGEPSD